MNLTAAARTIGVVIFTLGMGFFTLATSVEANGITYFVSPQGADSNDGRSEVTAWKSIQKAVDAADAGDTIKLGVGTYTQDVVSKRHGSTGAPITITGPQGAVVKGGGNGRIIEINHDYIVLDGFTVDGLFGSASKESGYRDKLIYMLGKETRDGVNGVKIVNMTLKNAGGECVRMRYFAHDNEIANNTITNCGVHDFKFNDGGKNGEGVYIGTAPEQLGDGKNPTKDRDVSRDNWVHHNVINTQGNECVDIKEAATANLIEYNQCTGQMDTESAGLDSRGSGNIFRFNQSSGNKGAGIRLGGDASSDGLENHVYMNLITNNERGGIKFQRKPQGYVCGNTFSDNTGGDAVGSYKGDFSATDSCPDSMQVSVPSWMSESAPLPSPSPITNPVSVVGNGLTEVQKTTLRLIRDLMMQMVEQVDALLSS